MELRYDDAVKERLRYWRETDRSLYDAVEAQLTAIKGDPSSHGIAGTPHVPRLVSFGVSGRDEQYVITWEVGTDVVYIGDVCSVSEMQQRARLRNPPPRS